MKLFDKLSLVFSARVHGVLDDEIDRNSIPVLKLTIGRVEEAEREIKRQLATAMGAQEVLKRERTRLEAKVSTSKTSIHAIRNDDDPSNDHKAIGLAKTLVEDERRLEETLEELADASKAVEALSEKSKQITRRREGYVSDLRSLEVRARTAAAKTRAADTLEKAGAALDATGGLSVDGLRRKIERDAATADARLDQAMASSASDEDELEAEAIARLVQLDAETQ